MAAFWLLLVFALCGLYFVVGETVNKDPDSGLAQENPGIKVPGTGGNSTVNGTTSKPPVTNTTKNPSNTTGTTPGTTNSTTNGTSNPPSTGPTTPSKGNETTPPDTSTTPPTTGTTPPNNPPSDNNPSQTIPIPPTSWLYPGFFWPPMAPSSSSFDSYDEHESDESDDVIIEDFRETITIHKKTIRKKQNKYKEADTDTDVSQNSDNNYGDY